jgi:hypothetical protein
MALGAISMARQPAETSRQWRISKGENTSRTWLAAKTRNISKISSIRRSYNRK